MIYPTYIITKSVCRQDGGDCECVEVLKIVILLFSLPTYLTSIDFTKITYYNKIRNCCPSVDNRQLCGVLYAEEQIAFAKGEQYGKKNFISNHHNRTDLIGTLPLGLSVGKIPRNNGYFDRHQSLKPRNRKTRR